MMYLFTITRTKGKNLDPESTPFDGSLGCSVGWGDSGRRIT